jgi:hypothetical protein
MIKKMLLSALLMVAVVTVSFAADLTGHWTGKINDQFDVAYDFKADGNTFTGTTKGPDGAVIDIKDGVINGDDITFSFPLMGNVTPIKGKLKGDVLTLSFSINGMDITFDLKKDAAK